MAECTDRGVAGSSVHAVGRHAGVIAEGGTRVFGGRVEAGVEGCVIAWGHARVFGLLQHGTQGQAGICSGLLGVLNRGQVCGAVGHHRGGWLGLGRYSRVVLGHG